MTTISCATGTLSPYVPSSNNPWNTKKVQHLYRRLAFGVTRTQISAALNMSPSDLVDQIIDNALTLPLSPEPEWANYTHLEYQDDEELYELHLNQWIKQWISDMNTNGFRDKLTFFWHNHFVTELNVYNAPPFMYQYHKVLQENALGNFDTFVRAIGLTGAMLKYLNGNQNTKEQPNENYARELYELFTLGHNNNYTQNDIEETARALTGWQVIVWNSPFFNDNRFDDTDKTIFGQIGNWNYDDVIDVLFAQRSNEVAKHICTKLYKYFVSHNPDETIIAEMANTFLANNFEIAPVLRELFKSEHFFDEANIGTKFKSPYDLLLGFFGDTGVTLNEDWKDLVYWGSEQLGQVMFNPIDVAGWQGDKNWVTGGTIITRHDFANYFLYDMVDNDPETLRTFAKTLTNNSSDPFYIGQVISDYFLAHGFHDPQAYFRAELRFKADIPQNYFEDGSWSLDWDTAPWQIALLIQYITKQPEFQLA